MGFIISGVTSTDTTLVIISLIFPHGLSNSPFETLKEEDHVHTLSLCNWNENDQNSKNFISLRDLLLTSQLNFHVVGKSADTGRQPNFLTKMGK